ncbi:class I SAM-dependent methyltransferase [bacterium]|nr:class I SAM-dependent methyltransferase [bacterium]
MSNKLIECKCPCCGGDEIIDKFTANNHRTKNAGTASYVRCKLCGSLYVNTRSISIDKNNNYDERYQHTYEKLIKKLRKKSYRFFACRMYGLLSGFSHITLPHETVEGDELLDIGCGIGLQTKLLQKRGIQITGIDSSFQAVKFAREINDGENFVCADFLDFNINNNNKFSFIRLDNVIEHIEEPEHFFERVSELLDYEGKLIIFTPNADSASIKLLRGKSVSAWPDEHLIIYSRNGLVNLLERMGFTIVKMNRNTPAWWLAYNFLMIIGVGNKVTADSFLLKIISLFFLPVTFVLNFLNLEEEIVVEAVKV